MKKQVEGQLTLFPGDSPVSRSPLPGSAEARKMTVTSGLKCLESYENSGLLSSLVRMCLGSSIWHSTRCLLTWKRKDTKANVSLFQLVASMPRTNDTESQFWPTLCANGMGSTGHQMMLQRMVDRGLMTEEERRQMIRGNGGKINPDWAEWLMGYMTAYTRLIPTPTATDYRGGCLARYWTPKRLQVVQVARERERERKREAWVRWSAAEFRGSQPPWEDWLPEPGVGRVADGVPNRVDRLKCLGNAVVPQQFYPFFYFMRRLLEEE